MHASKDEQVNKKVKLTVRRLTRKLYYTLQNREDVICGEETCKVILIISKCCAAAFKFLYLS